MWTVHVCVLLLLLGVDVVCPRCFFLEQTWDLGLAVCAMRDRLDKIAPGARKKTDLRSRVKQYPATRPAKPTRQSILQDTGMKDYSLTEY